MFKKYDCTNDDGTYDGYNSCYLHNDKKGFNFFITNDTVDINIFVRTKENAEGKFETNVQVKDRDSDGPENSRHDITFTSEEPVNIETIYENFNDEFSEGSNKNWDEIFDEYSAFASPEKVKGDINNSDIWNELKNENNVDLEISENWNYNGWGNYSNHYIKNEKDPYIKSFYSSKTSFCMSEPNLSVGLCVHDISLRTIKRENNKITFILREYETYLGEYFFTVEYISPNEVYVVKEIKNDSRLGFYERNQRRRIENNEIIQEAMSYIK